MAESSTFFSRVELECKHCDRVNMDATFLTRLDSLRRAFSKPMYLSSAYRCPEHNEAVSSTGKTGPHTTGHAVDILVNRADCLEMIRLALGLGFTGFGIKQHGDVRFLHLDDLPDAPGQPRPTIWSY